MIESDGTGGARFRSQPKSDRMAPLADGLVITTADAPRPPGFVSAMNSRQALEIRFHDVAYATDTRITSKFRHRAGFGAPHFSQGLERHIETDFIPIFETVGYEFPAFSPTTAFKPRSRYHG